MENRSCEEWNGFTISERPHIQDGCALEFVPADKQTDELCRAAIRQDGHAIQFVKRPTDELVAYADEQQYVQFTRREYKYMPLKNHRL